MPTSTDKNVAICTAVDAATGFVFALACPDKTSKCVSRLLLETIIPYFGPPKRIVTDLGVENMNTEVSQLLACRGCEKRSYKYSVINVPRYPSLD